MSGSAEFELTGHDYVDAHRTHSGWLALLFFVATVMFAELDIRRGVPLTSDWNLWMIATIGLMFLLWEFAIKDAIIRRQFRQLLPMRSPLKVRWDADALWIDTDTSKARYDWTQFFRWKRSKTTLMLYRDPGFFIPIVRRAVSDGEFNDLVAALQAADVKQR